MKCLVNTRIKYLICKRKILKCDLVFTSFLHTKDTTSSKDVKGPLHGIKICDMTRVLAGPFCTMVLGDMGADVIKIERKNVGDETRSWGIPVMGQTYYNMSINRNKRSICIDIQKESERNIIYEIVKQSDVFIENFVYGKLDKLGLGYKKLSELNPSLIYCSINGYGSRGGDKEKPGYDLVANACGGLLHITGPPDGGPCRPGVAVADILTGLYAHTAILSALHERTITNIGKKINVSLLQSQVAMLSYHASDYLNKGVEATRLGSKNSYIAPCGAFGTSDGELVISAPTNETFKGLCTIIGDEQLCMDGKFTSNHNRLLNRDELEHIISDIIKEKPTRYWIDLFADSSVPCSPVNRISEAFDSDEISCLNTVHELNHPLVDSFKVTGPGVCFDRRSFVSVPSHPPLLGEHTEQVVNEVMCE